MMVSYTLKVGKNCLLRKDLREKNKKMLFKWKNGSRDLPRERLDVSPADWERKWPWDILSNRGYGGQSMQGQGK